MDTSLLETLIDKGEERGELPRGEDRALAMASSVVMVVGGHSI